MADAAGFWLFVRNDASPTGDLRLSPKPKRPVNPGERIQSQH